MHYYQFNIADYRKDTQHLTPMEHYIYRELMDWYYLDERPIPLETNLVSRRLRLVSENNPEVKNVLEEFFTETENGWVHGRIEHEIGAFRKRQETARVNGSKGGRPPKPRKTKAVFLANPEKPNGKLTNNQKPITKSNKPNGLCENPRLSPVPYQQIIDLYHEKLPKLPKVVKLTEGRKRHIRARWKGDAGDIKFWSDYFDHAASSDFIHGKNDRGWFADIDFLIREDVMTKMQEGKYHA